MCVCVYGLPLRNKLVFLYTFILVNQPTIFCFPGVNSVILSFCTAAFSTWLFSFDTSIPVCINISPFCFSNFQISCIFRCPYPCSFILFLYIDVRYCTIPHKRDFSSFYFRFLKVFQFSSFVLLSCFRTIDVTQFLDFMCLT